MEPHAVQAELVDLEHAFWRALAEKDAATMVELTDDPCIVTGPQGVARIDHATLAMLVARARYSLDAFELDDVKVRLVDDDVAMLAYTVHEDVTVDGKRVRIDGADSSVWVRRDGRWSCAMHTEAIVGDPFGRDRRPDAP